MNASVLRYSILHAEQLALDIQRLVGTGDDVANGLLRDAAEHHARLTDCLTRVAEQTARVVERNAEVHPTFRPLLNALSPLAGA